MSAALRQAFTQLDHPHAEQTMRHVADQRREKWPKLGAFIDGSEWPRQHRYLQTLAAAMAGEGLL